MHIKKLPLVITSAALAAVLVPTALVTTVSAGQTAEAQTVTAPNSSVMSAKEKQKAIDSMTKPNDGNVLGWTLPGYGPNGGPGQYRAGSVVQGGLLNMSNPAKWWTEAYRNSSDAQNAAVQNKWFDIMEPWGVFMEMEGNTAKTLNADVRNVQVYVLREGKSQWELLHEDKQGIAWTNQYLPDMKTAISGAAGEQKPVAGSQGGTSTNIEVGTGNVNHWGASRLNNIPDPSSIRGVMVTAESRLSENTPADAKLGFHLGMDYKYADDDQLMKWYPGAGLSRVHQLSKNWERYYFVNLNTAQDATAERSISEDQFLKTTVPLPDLNAQ